MIGLAFGTTLTSGIGVAAAVLQDVADGKIEDALKPVVESAQNNYRSLPGIKNDRLADDIHVEKLPNGEFSVIGGERKNGTFYGHLVENGFRGSGKHPGQPPKPFLLPAFEEHRESIIEAVGDGIDSVV